MNHSHRTPNQRLPWWAALILLTLLGATLHLLTHQQMIGGSITGSVLLVLAAHFGLAAALVGALRGLRRPHKKASPVEVPTFTMEAVFVGPGNNPAPEELSAVGGRLLSCFKDEITRSMQEENVYSGERIQERLLGVVDQMAQFLDRLQTDGRIQVPDSRASAALFVAGVHSLATVEAIGQVSDGKQHDLGHAVPLFATALWNGLKP